jgi:hypothetical protein
MMGQLLFLVPLISEVGYVVVRRLLSNSINLVLGGFLLKYDSKN